VAETTLVDFYVSFEMTERIEDVRFSFFLFVPKDHPTVQEFLEELNTTILSDDTDPADAVAVSYAMAIEFGNRLTSAEVFDNFIPGPVSGEGKNRRRFRIDGYQLDDADGSVHIAITDFSHDSQVKTITKGDVDSIFGQAEHFIEVCADGGFQNRKTAVNEQEELSSYIERYTKSEITHFRFHLFTNREISKQLKELSAKEVCGVPCGYQIWDLGRMRSLTLSAIGSEEFVVDFTEFTEKGIPCLKANETHDYEGYLAVIDGETLAGIYDRYGSRVLEGNVRAYLSARGKVNKGIQATISNDADKFFAYNNGISCTSTGVNVEQDGDAFYLKSASYLQIVNGGQTTASIYIASKSGRSGFSSVSDVCVQMKLSVIKEKEVEGADSEKRADALEDLIYHIARFSNTQNMVKESDFFSNHEFHRIFEGHSQRIQAPPISGETTQGTYWFYERARGAYDARQMVLRASEQQKFKRDHPRSQRLEKTDIAKYIHAWDQRPYDVCDSGQRNFNKFANSIISNWGSAGARFRSPDFFKETIAKAILYKRLEKLVEKAPWYPKGSGFRQGIVSYTVALLSYLIQTETYGGSLNFKKIWMNQKLSPVLEAELLKLAERTCEVISAPAYESASVSIQGLQWFKKEACWEKLKDSHRMVLSDTFLNELRTSDQVRQDEKDIKKAGQQESEVDQIQVVMGLGSKGWKELQSWSVENNPRYGMEMDLVSRMTSPKFYPSPKQTKILYRILKESIDLGFKQ
jgi:hypothetical protein